MFPATALPEKSQLDPGLSIQADHMTLENQLQKAVFTGSVVIIKGDVTIHADFAEIFFSGGAPLSSPGDGSNLLEPGATPDGERDISQIEISGNVIIQQGLKKATSEKAVYERDREVVILTGNPVIQESGNEVHGKKVTLFLNENRSEVEESRVLIQPNGKRP